GLFTATFVFAYRRRLERGGTRLQILGSTQAAVPPDSQIRTGLTLEKLGQKREARFANCADRASVSAGKLKCRCAQRRSVRGFLPVAGAPRKHSFLSCCEERRVERPCLPSWSATFRAIHWHCGCAARPRW